MEAAFFLPLSLSALFSLGLQNTNIQQQQRSFIEAEQSMPKHNRASR